MAKILINKLGVFGGQLWCTGSRGVSRSFLIGTPNRGEFFRRDFFRRVLTGKII